MKSRDNKPHIGIFGRRNNGKSSLINALAGQEIAIVSEVAGTTTDPVRKSIEIEGIGPAVMIDTAGIDDSGELGLKRIARSREMLKIIDMAILVIAENTFGDPEQELIRNFRRLEVPFLVVHNKSDIEPLSSSLKEAIERKYETTVVSFSAGAPDRILADKTPAGSHPESVIPAGTTLAMDDRLVRAIRETMPETAWKKQTLVGDLISPGDLVLLITPIDIEAPEGRMILPQVQVIRDVLDHDGICVVCKEHEISSLLAKLNPKPRLAVTDSQVFPKADASVPKDISLTSFSIVLARQKGDFEKYLEGTPHINQLRDGDRVLILESCTHHVSCDDIGRVKIPRWLNNFTGKKLEFEVIAGLSAITRPISEYALVIQCGGCMITRKQLHNRLRPAIEAGIPVTNYGMTIAFVHGIFNRATEVFRK